MNDQVKEQEQKAADSPSVDDVAPAEEGGPAARAGFNYQDEVAVSLLLDMLEDATVLKTHCETHDDLVVVRVTEEVRSAEYVQVKAAQLDKLWSLADLCKRKDGKSGTSIYERSLARDAHKEQSRYRILTLRPVVAELQILRLLPGSVGRESGCEAITEIKTQLEARIPGFVSKNGNGCLHWLENCLWDERHDEAIVCDSNRLRVLQISAKRGRHLLPESGDVLLDELRAWVKRAGAAKWVPDRDKKIITRDQLSVWWDAKVSELTEAGGPSGGKLARKLKAANLPDEVVNLAVDLRLGYAEQLRTTRYAEPEECALLLDRVKAEAMSLRSRYVAGQIDVDGAKFHSMCLDRLAAINNERPNGAPDQSAFLMGCLYDIADRCLVRFARPEQ